MCNLVLLGRSYYPTSFAAHIWGERAVGQMCGSANTSPGDIGHRQQQEAAKLLCAVLQVRLASVTAFVAAWYAV